MRDPGFPIAFRSNTKAGLALHLTTARHHPAHGLIADGTIGPSIVQLADVLNAATPGNPAAPPRIEAIDGTNLAITLDPRVFSQDWHIAALLNLIENAIFIGQSEDPVILSGTVVSSHLNGRSVADLQSALVGANEAARIAVLDRLGAPGWPEKPRDVLYDLTWSLTDPLSPDAATAVSDRFWQINDLMTASAFEPEASPLDWLEDDLLPHAAGLEAKGATLMAGIEMPPMDPALALDLFEGVLRQEWDLRPTKQTARFRKGW
ncbi:hypothetical protein EGN72_02025 [Pseudorhodobacter sp. E13]|uniref:hypothetical protein n=1 Tax=Pseudorhodobacter sp. E13 TaxID=2487931 RepID=UPI000F8E6754|nr:hypothetical protein [Pseudorhodobacter sp. E13]RUS65019.1 hypothetical protein EGN72_02025 [Pseudorhodobacter sp. E13]